MNNKLILIKKLQQGGGLEVSPYLQSFLQMYDQPQQPVNSPVAYSVPVVQTSNPIPEDQREEEHPLSFMDNIQRYSGSNYTKVGPKTVKKKNVYPKQQASVVQSSESKESEPKESEHEEPKVNKKNTQNPELVVKRPLQNQEQSPRKQSLRALNTQNSQAKVSRVNIQKSTDSSPKKPRFIAGVPNYEPIPEEYNPLYGPKRAVQEIYKFLNSLIN